MTDILISKIDSELKSGKSGEEGLSAGAIKWHHVRDRAYEWGRSKRIEEVLICMQLSESDERKRDR